MALKATSRILALVLLLVVAFATFFSQRPFIHQEEVYQAKWYTESPSVFQTLFDPAKNDGAPGRFRYVEYLAEGGYWNLAKAGLLPKSLYDYSAIFVTLLIQFFLFRVGRLRGVSFLALFSISAILWLSVPTFMIVTWHYRKAKFLAALFLIALAWALEARKSRGWIMILVTLGFFTDPFFIVLSPLLFLGRKADWKVAVASFGTAIGILVLLNGVIGPALNEGTALILTQIPSHPPNFLNLQQVGLFAEILPQLLGFSRHGELGTVWPWMLLGLLVATCGLASRVLPHRGIFLWGFLLALPIAAVVVHPSYNHEGIYCSYYGYPVFVLFLLALLEGAEMAKLFPRAVSMGFGLLATAFLVGSHQLHRQSTFQNWKDAHVENLQAARLVDKDIDWLKELRTAGVQKGMGPYLQELQRLQDTPLHIYSTQGGTKPHSSVAFELIPIFYAGELKTN